MVFEGLMESFEILKNPSSLAKKKAKGSLSDGVMLLAVGGAVGAGVGSFLGMLFLMNFVGAIFGLIVGAIVGAIAAPLGALLFNILTYIVAKLLGGKAGYSQQYYMVALASAAGIAISMVLQNIPLIGGLLGFVFGLYVLYVEIVAMKEAHGFDMLKAAASVLIPAVIILVVVMVLAVMIAAMLMALGFGLAGSSMMRPY
ncbi:Yip1 domain protein [Candidatus Burarchaeum australiense]|nr:Yip1 domain protein [Candidatus Burarchaeum australiense]